MSWCVCGLSVSVNVLQAVVDLLYLLLPVFHELNGGLIAVCSCVFHHQHTYRYIEVGVRPLKWG